MEKRWYNMILSGEKKEEYRECKPFWIKRLTKPEYHNMGQIELIHKLASKEAFRTDYDVIQFSNGYQKGCRKMTVELRGMHYGFPSNLNWIDGLNENNFYICLELGKILSYS